MFGLHLGLNRIAPVTGDTTPGDTTPGGASDVWLWETGIGLLWETGIFMLTE